jgi:hypothetical protein
MGKPTVIPVWFGGETGVSNVCDLSMVDAVVGLVTPAEWTPAMLTIEGSPNGVDFYPMYDGMSIQVLNVQVPPGSIIAIGPNRLRCCQAIRLLSGMRGNLVPQGSPREFGLVVELTPGVRLRETE